MPTWKINLKEQTATSVKERYHLQSQKLTSEWMEGHGGIEAERKLINGVSDEKDENQTTHILTHYCFFVF
mgnify:CR=1 FL=1